MDIKKKNKKKNAPLPPDLIEEILLRLAVKSLVRFKSVSKQWRSLILDTRFSKSHTDLAAATSTNWLLYVTRNGPEARCVCVDTSISCEYVLQLPLPYHRNLEMMGSCRGFILLVYDLRDEPCLILWNPLIGVHKTLSYPPNASNALRRRRNPQMLGLGYCLCGLGHDMSTDDYLVVTGWCDHIEIHWEIFSVRTNSWKQIASIPFSYEIISVACEFGVFFNGAIHWLAFIKNHGDVEAVDPRAEVIIAFDLVGKNLSEIPLPDIQCSCFRNLTLLGGCLGVCCRQVNKTEIWVMKEYKVMSTWTKLSIMLPRDTVITSLCFTKGDELVVTNYRGRLVKFNDKGKLVEHQVSYVKRGIPVVFTETLLSLPGEIENAREDGR